MTGDLVPKDEATECTRLLRSSLEPRWGRLRARLAAEGIEPRDAAVGTLFQDDVRMEFGILLSRNGRAFQFTFDFLRDPEGNEIRSPADAWIQLWKELSEDARQLRYSGAIAAAGAVLRRDAE